MAEVQEAERCQIKPSCCKVSLDGSEQAERHGVAQGIYRVGDDLKVHDQQGAQFPMVVFVIQGLEMAAGQNVLNEVRRYFYIQGEGKPGDALTDLKEFPLEMGDRCQMSAGRLMAGKFAHLA